MPGLWDFLHRAPPHPLLLDKRFIWVPLVVGTLGKLDQPAEEAHQPPLLHLFTISFFLLITGGSWLGSYVMM